MGISLKSTQSKLFDLLVFLDDVCKKNEITYWIDGGTFLGAVRSGGFIPWDDDLDVGVLEKDYFKLIECLKKEVKKTSSYFLYNQHRNYEHLSEYLGDSTVLKGNFLPIEIDIVRIKSFRKGDTTGIQKDRRLIEVLKYFFKMDYNRELLEGHVENDFVRNKKFSARKKMFNYFLGSYLPSLVQDGDDLVYGYCYGDLYVKKDRPFYTRDQIFPLKRIEFEGRMFPCPADQSGYLTILYGENYLSPPPVDFQKPSAGKSRKNILPRRVTTFGIYVIYYLKEIKSWAVGR